MNYSNLKVTFTFLLLLAVYSAGAHNGGSCSHMYKKRTTANKATTATPEEDYYDVKYLKFDLGLTNTSTAITGDVTTHAQITAPGFNVYAFELNSQITIDSVFINGTKTTSYNRSGSIVRVNLPSVLPINSLFTSRVFYHGQPTAGTGFFTRGLNTAILSTGTRIMYTLSDMYTAEDWWPSKQSIQDKIDSADIWVTVDDTLKAGSNGLLKNITPMPGGKKRFEWKTRYPIEYYLISVAVAPYADYSYYMHFTDGSGDSMLVQNYVVDSASFMTPANRSALDTTGYIVDYFSKLFGKYPFYKEKYGHCMAVTLGGGMEHQTMTTLAYATPTLIAHELGHQWWGDHVTYGTWQDIWLSEGFASYTEQLYIEHFHSSAAMQAYRTDVHSDVIASPGGTVYVDDTTSTSRVFSPRLTYRKGAAVTHMLRYMAPHDSLFFKLLRNFQLQYAFGLAITADLHQMAEQIYGIDLDTFFNQWIFKEGYPIYSLKWHQNGSQVYLQINQSVTRPASVPMFAMPVQIRLQSASGDTVVKLYNDMNSQNYSFNWGKAITGLQIDPYDNIVNKNGPIIPDPKLSVSYFDIEKVKVSPNPTGNNWEIANLPANAKLVLTEITGKVIWKGNATAKTVVPATTLPSGNYILTIHTTGNKPQQCKLVKL